MKVPPHNAIEWMRPEVDLEIEITRRHAADARSPLPLQPNVLSFGNALRDLHVENSVENHDMARVINLGFSASPSTS
jgi:hypothetical protein